MLKYDLILCSKVIAWFHESNGSFIDSDRKRKDRLADIIEQHRIVRSKQIDEMYKSSLPFAILDLWQQYIVHRQDERHDICSIRDTERAEDTFDDKISIIAKSEQIDRACVLCGDCDKKEELTKKMYPNNPAFLSKIQDEDVSNKIGRITADFHTRAKKDQRAKNTASG